VIYSWRENLSVVRDKGGQWGGNFRDNNIGTPGITVK